MKTCFAHLIQPCGTFGTFSYASQSILVLFFFFFFNFSQLNWSLVLPHQASPPTPASGGGCLLLQPAGMDGCSQVVRPIIGSLRLVSEAFPAAASFCILILSRERHQTWIKPLCQLNFGKTCLKLPLARGGTPPPSGTSWGLGGGRGGSNICFPLHPALAGWALGTDRLRIPHIVPIQPRDPETQGVSSKHYHRSICVPARKAGRVHSTAPPGLSPDSSLLSQFLILLWPPSEQGPPPTPTSPHTRWPEHLRPSS